MRIRSIKPEFWRSSTRRPPNGPARTAATDARRRPHRPTPGGSSSRSGKPPRRPRSRLRTTRCSGINQRRRRDGVPKNVAGQGDRRPLGWFAAETPRRIENGPRTGWAARQRRSPAIPGPDSTPCPAKTQGGEAAYEHIQLGCFRAFRCPHQRGGDAVMRIRSIKPEFWRSDDIDALDRQSWKRYGTSAPGEEFLYRFYDTDMRLLYVGITWNPFVRWTFHAKTKPWWPEVMHVDLHVCVSDRHVREWETWCIKNLAPIHNKHQNPRWHRGAH